MKGALASAAIVMLLVLWHTGRKKMIIIGTIIAIVMMMLMAFVCFVVTWIDFKIKDRELRRKNKISVRIEPIDAHTDVLKRST